MKSALEGAWGPLVGVVKVQVPPYPTLWSGAGPGPCTPLVPPLPLRHWGAGYGHGSAPRDPSLHGGDKCFGCGVLGLNPNSSTSPDAVSKARGTWWVSSKTLKLPLGDSKSPDSAPPPPSLNPSSVPSGWAGLESENKDNVHLGKFVGRLSKLIFSPGLTVY